MNTPQTVPPTKPTGETPRQVSRSAEGAMPRHEVLSGEALPTRRDALSADIRKSNSIKSRAPAGSTAETDEIGGRSAAEILHVPYPGSFNRLRKRLQQISVTKVGEKIARVPELGGVKYPGTEWIYSRSACLSFVARYRDGRRASSPLEA